MSALRARCPDCRTLTAVAIGPEYQCHSCGREFAAGLVRVPRAWNGGDVTGAEMQLPWPEAAVIDEASLAEQIDAFGAAMPARPLLLGGCHYAHVGAVRALARKGPLGIVWIDADAGPALELLRDDIEPAEVVRSLPALTELPDRIYVALDASAVRPDELEPLLAALPTPVGAGLTGFAATPANEVLLPRLARALGL